MNDESYFRQEARCNPCTPFVVHLISPGFFSLHSNMSTPKKRILIRATPEQLAIIDARCQALSTEKWRMPRSQYIWHAALGTLPPIVPELNRTAWLELVNVAGNLNQILRHIDSGKLTTDLKADTTEVLKALHGLRQVIIGAALTPPEELEA